MFADSALFAFNPLALVSDCVLLIVALARVLISTISMAQLIITVTVA